MMCSLSRLPWRSFARNGVNLLQYTTIASAERYARIRGYRSQQQGRRTRNSRGGSFLTYTALVSAFGCALYRWKDDIRERIEKWGVRIDSPVINAVSLPPSDNIGSNTVDNRRKYNFIADVVETSAPSVVYIEIRDNKRTDFFTGRPGTISNGSGFIVNSDGLILTNAHVVITRRHTSMQVRLNDGTMHTGTVEDIDMQSDLATVRINKTNLPVMKLGNSSDIRLGEFVVAIGSPLALRNTITSGVVSSVNRQIKELGSHRRHMGYIQTDAAITFGNSGGPLVNLNGEAIGINAMKIISGISFAIPIDHAKEFLKKAEAHKKGVRYVADIPGSRYMGITMQNLTPDILTEMQQNNVYKLVKHGVLVWKVMTGSPADVAGLQSGDIITHANDEPVVSSANIYKVLEKPGIVLLNVIRKEQMLQINVDPEDMY